MNQYTSTPTTPRPGTRHRGTPRRNPGRRRLARFAAAMAVVVGPITLGFAAGAPAAAPEARGGTLSNGCDYGPRGLPKCGAYLGAAHGANTTPTSLENQAGRRLGVRRTFFRADQVEGAVRIAREDLAAGRLPWISFKLPHSWEDMVAGRGDAWARDIATRLDNLDGPVWLAFHHEPEGDGDVQAWRRMQERLAPLVRQTADNVAFTVILTGYNQFFGDPKYSLDSLWPRGVKIDVAGFDIYNQLGVTKDGKTNDQLPRMRTRYFEPLARWAAAHDTAWGIAETGLTHSASVRQPQWITKTYATLSSMGGVAFSYFDTDLNSVGSWPLTTDTKRRDFNQALQGTPVLPRG